jgi:hypothetical protein
MANTINADNGVVSSIPGLKYSADTSGVLILQTNTTDALTLDTTQGATFSTGVLVTNPYAGSYSGGMVLDHTTSLGRISVAASSAIAFYNGGISARVETMRIDASGNVGIGTASPTSKLDVSGEIKTLNDTASTGVIIKRTGGVNANGAVNFVGSDDAVDASVRMATDVANALTFTTGGTTERMRIDSSGNVLVGSTSIGSAATINLAIGTPGSVSGGITLWGANTSSHSINFGDGTSGADQYRGAIEYAHTGNSMRFYTDATERMRIDSSGNVGIGKTNPSQKLDVSGNLQVQGTNSFVYVDNGGVGGSALKLEVTGSTSVAVGADSNHPLLFKTNATERGRFDTSGNFLFNSGYGSAATAYGCRAWVNFNGTGTVAIRASGNVSSITDNGTGDYTVNFTNALVDTNYAYVGTGRRNNGTQRPINFSQDNSATYNPSTTALRFVTWVDAAAALEDALTFNVAIFR